MPRNSGSPGGLSANIAAFALEPDGSIGDWTAFVQHTGKSVHPQRQTHAYAHAIVVSPDNQFVLVPDLGVDKLFVYRFDEKTGKLAAHDPAFVEVPPGSGPRHVKFHPNGRWVYLINEMASTIVGYDWDAAKGTLTKFQSVSTLPSNFSGTCAEVEVHPNGKFLYGSNRGHDSLATFAIDAKNGHLSSSSTRRAAGEPRATLPSIRRASGSSAPTTRATTRSCSG